MISFTVNWEIFKWSRKKYPVWCFLFCFMMTIFAIPFSKSCFRKIFFFSTWLRFIQFHTTAEYKFYSSSHWLYTRRHWNISRDIKQGAKMSWSKGTEIIQSVLWSLWNYARQISFFFLLNMFWDSKCKETVTEVINSGSLPPQSFPEGSQYDTIILRAMTNYALFAWEPSLLL